MQTKALVSG